MTSFLHFITAKSTILVIIVFSYIILYFSSKRIREHFTKATLKQVFSRKSYTRYELFLLIALPLVIIIASVIWQSDMWSIISSVMGVYTVIFVSKGTLYNYPLGLFAVTTYAASAFTQGLYGEYMLNMFFYFPANIIGPFIWIKSIEKQQNTSSALFDIQARLLTWKQRAMVLVVVLVSIWAYAFFLNVLGDWLYALSMGEFSRQNVGYWDATTNVCSIIATFLMFYRYAEQWLLWLAINVASIVIWLKVLLVDKNMDALPFVLMWSSYFVNSCYGWHLWYKKSKQVVS